MTALRTLSVLGESLAGQAADRSLTVAARFDASARIEKLREAESVLLEGYDGMKDHPDAPEDGKRKTLERIVSLYETWHAVEPDTGYNAQAAEWRAKLGEDGTRGHGDADLAVANGISDNVSVLLNQCRPVCEGDANEDGAVDPQDSGFVLARFGCDVGSGDPDCDTADMNGDGLVDPLDVGFVLARFGECP